MHDEGKNKRVRDEKNGKSSNLLPAKLENRID